LGLVLRIEVDARGRRWWVCGGWGQGRGWCV
jgi:hypothetical protein